MSSFQKDDEIEGDKEYDEDDEDDEDDYDDGIWGTIEKISRDPNVRKAWDAFSLAMNIRSIWESGATVAYYYYFAGE